MTESSAVRANGQISILIVFSLIPLLTLFAFAVNIGMLVNAKVTLQNAADMAAFAGAAAQARQLSNISFLNYQLRQTYKKFIFKYYVLGNLGLRCFPNDASGSGQPNGCADIIQNGKFTWRNPGNLGFPGMPAVCVTLSPDSNPCQLGNPVPVVRQPTCVGVLDPSCNILRQAAAEIGSTQRLSCNANSVINQEILAHWLYATDEKGEIQSQVALAGLVEGVGLVTESLLINERINVLKSYVNAEAQNLTRAQVKNVLEESIDPVKFERSIMAFKSAAGNLSADVFDQDSITMREMLPSSEMLVLRPLQPSIDTAFAFMDGGTGASGQPSECALKLEFFKANPIVGVVKEPGSYVYYAVKLTAKAKLLFNPFARADDETTELTAYAAAAPFGSRIGPDLKDSDFVMPVRVRPSANDAPVNKNYPIIPLNDDRSQLNWEQAKVLGAYRELLTGVRNSNGGGGSVGRDVIGSADLQRGIHAAQLPDPFEVGRYNVPVDTDTIGASPNSETHEHMPYYRHMRSKNFTFWAPIHEQGAQDQFRQKMAAELDNLIFSIGQSAGGGVLQSSAAAIKIQLLEKIEGFLGDLRRSRRFNIAAIPDPLSQLYFKSSNVDPGRLVSAVKKITNQTTLATSYSTDHDRAYYNNGRVGYSVKFIPFKHLVNGGPRLSNTGEAEAKIPSMGSHFGPDLLDLKELAH